MKKVLLYCVLFTLAITVGANAQISYDFADSLQGWSTIMGGPDAYWAHPDNHPEGTNRFWQDVPHQAPGLVQLAQDDTGGVTQDSAHSTIWIQSPTFKLDGSGDLTGYLMAGAGDVDLTGTLAADVPQQSQDSEGFIGLALLNHNTGVFDLSARRASSGGNWEKVTITAAQLAALDQGALYSLNYIDSKHGGWGWSNLDTVSIPAMPANRNAVNPVPADGATGIDLDQDLSWDATNDPNIVSTTYAIYLDPNEALVTSRDPSVCLTASQAEITFDPGTLALYSTPYYWVVDADNTMNYVDPNNVTVKVLEPGKVWCFETLSEYRPPMITGQSVITLKDLLPQAFSAVVTNNSDDLVSVSLELMDDDMDYPTGANVQLNDETTDLTAPVATLSTDLPGVYKVKFIVNDGTTTAEEIVEVVVYEDACQAKKDSPSGWTQDVADLDANCTVDMNDFAMIAAQWLNDTSMKMFETYDSYVIVLPAVVYESRIEAETGTLSSGVSILDLPAGAGSGQYLGTTSTGSYAEFVVDIPEAGTYDLYLRSSAPAGSDDTVLNFGIGDAEDTDKYGSVTGMPATSWEDYYTTSHIGALTFTEQGSTTVRISWASGGRNLDWFSIVQQQ